MSDREPANRTIRVDALARVEGEGAMVIETVDGRVHDVRLRIYEPPRFFEAFLRGRRHTEPPDITARVCGICPVAYQMSACQAIEHACGVVVDGPLADLRRLLYCGEWIESHTLHVYLLHAPDFLGYPSAVAMAADHREAVERGLQLKKAGNDLIEALGGRAVHPINVRIGGFYRVPTKREVRSWREPLLRARDAALETVRWVAGFEFPDFEHDHAHLALRHPDRYAIEQGRLVSSGGLDAPVHTFDEHVVESHVEHSHALHAHLRSGGGRYLVGPLARYSLNSAQLSPIALEAAREAGLGATCRNPFRSIVVRAVETLYAVDEAIRLIDAYEEPDAPAVEVAPRAGVGHGATEAPRGLLYHRYELDEQGLIVDARLVPPTSQNQPAIEHDLHRLVEDHLHLDDERLTARCEQAVRNYDPCISCATHFLDVTVVERGAP
jgi:coenzyme F420-reducing hydrogenase alpha subunit